MEDSGRNDLTIPGVSIISRTSANLLNFFSVRFMSVKLLLYNVFFQVALHLRVFLESAAQVLPVRLGIFYTR